MPVNVRRIHVVAVRAVRVYTPKKDERKRVLGLAISLHRVRRRVRVVTVVRVLRFVGIARVRRR